MKTSIASIFFLLHAYYYRWNHLRTYTHRLRTAFQDSKSVEDLLMRFDQRSGYVFENYDYERNPFGRLRPQDTVDDESLFVDDNDEKMNTTIDPM